MPVLTIKNGGRIVRPKELLDHLGLPVGGRLEVVRLPGGELQLSAIRETAGGCGNPGTPEKTRRLGPT